MFSLQSSKWNQPSDRSKKHPDLEQEKLASNRRVVSMGRKEPIPFLPTPAFPQQQAVASNHNMIN